MKIIDCHLHFSAKGIFDKTAENIGVKCTLDELNRQFIKNNIVLGIGMGVDKCTDNNLTNPQVIYHGQENFPPFLMQCLGIDARSITKENFGETLARFEEKLQENTTVGLKVFTGYQPFFCYG